MLCAHNALLAPHSTDVFAPTVDQSVALQHAQL